MTSLHLTIRYFRVDSVSDMESDLFCGWRDSGCLATAASVANAGQPNNVSFGGSPVQFPSLAMDWGRSSRRNVDLVIYVNSSNVLVS